ncbi:hypothetical protein sr17215 [Sporisorium reilianum SRZ2]|uniref:Uncharacterized protein n=1 Tax=Sporisorium reilianum (strain SRZ2) TaxID=999809 RepID=E7A016_SPORE|nr:hypothetical protein sr17215 [Sporisorium reilianum SRZ2]
MAQTVEDAPPYYRLRKWGTDAREAVRDFGSDAKEALLEHPRLATGVMAAVLVPGGIYEVAALVDWIKSRQQESDTHQPLHRRELASDDTSTRRDTRVGKRAQNMPVSEESMAGSAEPGRYQGLKNLGSKLAGDAIVGGVNRSAALQKRGGAESVAELTAQESTAARTAQLEKARRRAEVLFWTKMTAIGTAIVAVLASPWEWKALAKYMDARDEKKEEARQAREAQPLARRANTHGAQAGAGLERRMVRAAGVVEAVPSGAAVLRALRQVALGVHRSGMLERADRASLHGVRPTRRRVHRRPWRATDSASPADLARIAGEVARMHPRAAARGGASLQKRAVAPAGEAVPTGMLVIRVVRQIGLGNYRSGLFGQFADEEEVVSTPPRRQRLWVHEGPPPSLASGSSASTADLTRIARQVALAHERAVVQRDSGADRRTA